MLKSWRARKLVTAALVAAAVGPLGVVAASAQAATVVDDTAAQFSLGTPAGTVVRTLIAPDGAVELARTLDEKFDVDGLPAGWTSTAWPSGGATTVAGGALLVDGAHADSGVSTGPRSSLEFTATFGSQPSGHVGFATDFDQQPWAIFSTGSGGGKVYARTSAGPAPLLQTDEELLGVDANAKNDYRIDWTASGFEYYVNGTLKATHAIPLTAQMRAQASDYVAGNGGVSVDSMVLSTHVASGTYTSHSFDGGDKVVGLSFKATGVTPDSTTVTYETRTAASAAGLDGATWMPVTDGKITSPVAQFLQYRATMTTSVPAATPRLDKVEIGFTVDDQAPVVTIDPVAVSGATAKVTFHSDDATATDTCKLDGGAFASCTSPKTLSDLADGSHTVVVQATDSHLNTGTATKTFDVDTRAPTVTISDVAVSGAATKVMFSSDDAAAVVKCSLDGAAFAACASPATFSGLRAGSHAVVVQSTDAHGNVGSATRTFEVAPSAGPGTTPPPPSGGGTTPPPTGTPRDLTAPKVRITERSVHVSKGGIARIRVTCPTTEVRCTVVVKLKLGGNTVARKTLTVRGGTTRALDLRLSKSTRSTLAARVRIKVTAVVTATDAAANHKTTQVRMTLRAPSH